MFSGTLPHNGSATFVGFCTTKLYEKRHIKPLMSFATFLNMMTVMTILIQMSLMKRTRINIHHSISFSFIILSLCFVLVTDANAYSSLFLFFSNSVYDDISSRAIFLIAVFFFFVSLFDFVKKGGEIIYVKWLKMFDNPLTLRQGLTALINSVKMCIS